MAQRPQQPTTGAPASLPTETLAQFLACALEGLEPWERQQERVRFSKVCSGWYGAAETSRQLVVKDTKMAERLIKALTVGGAARRQKVRSLVITAEKEGTGRGQRIGALLKLCRSITELELRELRGDLGGSNYLGTHIHDALRNLKQLQRFAIPDSDSFTMMAAELRDAVKKWPKIRTLEILGVSLRHDDYQAPKLGEPITFPLTRLHMSLDRGFGSLPEPLHYFLASNSSTLRHLDLGAVNGIVWVMDCLTPTVMAPIAEIALQIHSLTAKTKHNPLELFSPRQYLSSTLSRLKDIRTLELGVNGFDLATILPILQPLQHLETLSITEKGAPCFSDPFSRLESQAAVDFLSSAPAIRFCTLPHQLVAFWLDDEIEDVETAAQKCGVVFKLA